MLKKLLMIVCLTIVFTELRGIARQRDVFGQTLPMVAESVTPDEFVQKLEDATLELSGIEAIRISEHSTGGKVISYRLFKIQDVLYYNVLVFQNIPPAFQLCLVRIDGSEIVNVTPMQKYLISISKNKTISPELLEPILGKITNFTIDIVSKISQLDDDIQIISSRLALFGNEDTLVYHIIVFNKVIPSFESKIIDANTGEVLKSDVLSNYPLKLKGDI